MEIEGDEVYYKDHEMIELVEWIDSLELKEILVIKKLYDDWKSQNGDLN